MHRELYSVLCVNLNGKEIHDSQPRIVIAGRNINNLRYADDIILMAESKEELKSVLMRVKEESGKAGLKLNIQKTNIMTSGPVTLCQIDGEKVETKAMKNLDSTLKSRDITLPAKV